MNIPHPLFMWTCYCYSETCMQGKQFSNISLLLNNLLNSMKKERTYLPLVLIKVTWLLDLKEVSGKKHVSLEWSTVYALFIGILNSCLKRRKKYRYDLFRVSTLRSLVELGKKKCWLDLALTEVCCQYYSPANGRTADKILWVSPCLRAKWKYC